LKGKFLEGRRNHRLDHLIHVLVDLVLPYYLLKERRQKLGFEGENLENQKRLDIIRNSQTIKASDIDRQVLDHADSGATYLVKSVSRPGQQYSVDVTAYTCTCPDYPVIQFCKHLHAIQAHFPDLASSNQLNTLSTGSEISTILDLDEQTLGLGLSVPGTGTECPSSALVVDPESGTSAMLRSVSEKFERLVARFRLQGTPEQAKRLNAWLDHELSLESATPNLLPKRQKLSPRLNSWPETQAAMMPAKKTRPKRAGDQAYGAGESSGKRVKTLPKPLPTEWHPVDIVIANQNPVQARVLPAISSLAQAPVSSQVASTSSYYRPKTHLY